MISYFQAIVMGVVQGVTEPFPVSSLGHSVIIPKLFGWDLTRSNDKYVTFLVATHFATALVFLAIFWADWVRIVKGFFRSLANRKVAPGDTDARLAWLLIIGTVPAGLIGLALQKPLEKLFGNAYLVAVVLVLNGVMLLWAESRRRRARVEESDDDARLARSLTVKQSGGIGLAQALALIPGFSRSGATMSGGLLAGLSHRDAARFSFLLATPIILAAALLKMPGLIAGHAGVGIRAQALVGALAAAIASWISIKFLLRFFETNRLTPFGIYCIVAGAISLVWLLAIA
jgi:undecaprenyl-diphosphatase